MSGSTLDPLHRLRSQVQALLEELRAVVAAQPADQQPAWAECVATLEGACVRSRPTNPNPSPHGAVSGSQPRRYEPLAGSFAISAAAGLSRVQLVRLAKLSDATVKFLEGARHPPSRATLLRLISVEALKLSWADVPGQPRPPAGPPSSSSQSATDRPWLQTQLNCFLTPSCDPLTLMADLAQFLNGDGGHLEQPLVYLDPFSAAAYLALCHQSLAVAKLRRRLPLEKAAQQIANASGAAKLQVLALGAGYGQLKARLARHRWPRRYPSLNYA